MTTGDRQTGDGQPERREKTGRRARIVSALPVPGRRSPVARRPFGSLAPARFNDSDPRASALPRATVLLDVERPSLTGQERLGTILGGRYELRDVIAEGGQGFLFRARDLRDGDDVAIKILRDASVDPDAVERFFREAHAMMQLAGTAAVRVLGQVTASQGAVGIVMEFLRGRELLAELEELEAANERMPEYRIREIFGPIVKTLEAAHRVGIVHRDIKPENIYLIHAAYGGGVRLLDFGFARFTRSRPITRAGMVAGSPTHLSPEAWKASGDLDQRADVYGLAVVLFRVLAGKLPFTGSLQQLMFAVIGGERPSLHALRPDLLPNIDFWVEHALHADRDQRFANVSAMFNALLNCFPKP
jgi:serine/threonine-protein kinase